MRPRFEADVQSLSGSESNSQLVAPKTYDDNDGQFAVSAARNGTPRFIVEEEGADFQGPASEDSGAGSSFDVGANEAATAGADSEKNCVSSSDPAAWRQEITSRLNSYRGRRRLRAPRYPSLQLKFSPLETSTGNVARACNASALPEPEPTEVPEAPPAPVERTPLAPAVETKAKIIEFPRVAAPPKPLDELAEPVLDRPRILEAPEPTPPPPALGGIIMEPIPEPPNDRRPGFEIPLQGAQMNRRVAAGSIDAAIVLSVYAGAAYLFSRFAAVPPLFQALSASAVFVWLSWSLYQYLMLVYTGSTPGLKLTKLQLRKFDDSPVPRRLRRWRVLASILSGFSLGLGYAWCFLDEDQLCWHDRITHTYMAPRSER